MREGTDIPAVIMAGGRGTRIVGVDDSLPKPMLKVCGKPILEYQIECLVKQGITDITIVVGHLGNIIRGYFGDGSRWGAYIRYYAETAPFGTAGALRYLDIKRDFLLLNGDLLFNVDICQLFRMQKEKHALATVLVHANDHPHDSELVVADDTGLVTEWLPRDIERGWHKNRVNAGLHILSPEVLKKMPTKEKVDLDKDLLRPNVETGRIYAKNTIEFILDVGTPERFQQAEKAVSAGRLDIFAKNKAIFLDRDGTINKYAGFLTDIDDFELLDGAAEGIRLFNQNGYSVFVVTNQPVIARGELDWGGLRKIHDKMETLLGEKGAYVNDIFICPHHPDKGFTGERPEYKTACDCRKPMPGLILQAAEKYNIDLVQSWMVGDSAADMEAGVKAGCKTAYIGEGKGYALRFGSLHEFAVSI